MSFITDKEIRSYLLGTLTDAPREQIEETLLISDEGLLRLEMAEEDLIEDFLDGQLDAEQTALFQNQFLCTSARKEKLAYVRAIRQLAARQSQPEPAASNVVSFPAQTVRQSFFVGMTRSKYLKLAAAIMLVSSVGFLVWRYAFRPAQDASLVALNRAYANGRTLETRIGGFDYAPYAPTRGANDADANARILRERAERMVLDAYVEHPSPATRHALGKYYLADKQFDKAIEQFNEALKETSSSASNAAELHNDLGAALLEKSKYEKRNNQPGDSLQHMAASLESIEQALKLHPHYPPAVFNRALCLQEMYLPRQAIEEWKKYLQLDSNSKWADEARRRLEELEKAPSKISKSDKELYQDYLEDPANDERTFDLFCQAYSTIGNGITEHLLDDFLAAKERRDDAEAAHKLQLLEKLGALIYQRTTDPYVRDVARYYQQLTPEQQPLLVKARHHLNKGRDLRTTAPSKAVANYEQAISLFRQAQDQCEVKMTTCLLARSLLRQTDLSKSRGLFTALASPKNKHLWIRGDSYNGIAECYLNQDRLEESIHANQLALALAQNTNNINLIILSLGALAVQFCDLGDWEQMLFYQQQVLEAFTNRSGNTDQQAYTIATAASNLIALEFSAAAIAYQQEVLHINQAIKRPLQLSRAYTHLGIILGEKKRFLEAISALKEAINIGAALKDEKYGLGIQAYSGLHLANIQRKSGNFVEALQSYIRAIKVNEQLNDIADDFEAYRGKALTEIALGQTAQARQDLTHALRILEQNRNRIFAEKERISFFDREYEIYDAAIDFAYSSNPAEAFDLSEKGRSRSLLESLSSFSRVNLNRPTVAFPQNDQIQPVTNTKVQQQIPKGVSLLQFACLPDRLIAWCISPDGITHSQHVISLTLLEQKVHTFLQAIAQKPLTGTNQVEILAADLYQILIQPLEPSLIKAETICIVPDKTLHRLPFAALYSTQQRKYLIENHALVITPSSSVFLLCSKRAQQYQAKATKHTVLAVGNPRFNQAAYPQLPDLTAAEREAKEVANNYPQHKILTGEQATEEKIKLEIQKVSVIHLASHGIIDERSLANSRLVLAKSAANNNEDGVLRAYEIAQMRLSAQLAVLSACQSSIGRFYQGEGMTGLSRAFLTAGVPSVVASFWAVDSDVTANLMTSFHQQLKKHSVSDALRRAQLTLLNSANPLIRHPYYWASFSVFGSDAKL